jgi:hypothetical protein
MFAHELFADNLKIYRGRHWTEPEADPDAGDGRVAMSTRVPDQGT